MDIRPGEFEYWTTAGGDAAKAFLLFPAGSCCKAPELQENREMKSCQITSLYVIWTLLASVNSGRFWTLHHVRGSA